jgi:hypothetical protein
MQRRALCKARVGHRADKGGARAGGGVAIAYRPIWWFACSGGVATLAAEKKKRPEVPSQSAHLQLSWPVGCKSDISTGP